LDESRSAITILLWTLCRIPYQRGDGRASISDLAVCGSGKDFSLADPASIGNSVHPDAELAILDFAKSRNLV
jgi:hypothetical protein